MTYAFDRFLRYEELTQWLHDTASAHPTLMAIDSYGHSHEGRDLWMATLTDASTGAHDTKPAHWVDANIHSVEVTAGVAALHLIERLVTGFGNDDTVTRALQTRTFYTTTERPTERWSRGVVRAEAGTGIVVEVSHQRAGSRTVKLMVG